MNDQADILYPVFRLVRLGRFREADEKLSDLLPSIPSMVRARLEWIKIASIRGDHDTALDRLRAANIVFPNIEWFEVLIELLIRARKLPQAEQAIRDIINKSRNGALKKADLLLRVQTLRKLDTSFKAASENASRDFMCICINLDEHPEKWQRALREASLSNMNLSRLPGVRGSYLADHLMPLFGKGVSRNLKGTLGCFLSHFAAWERLLKSDLDHALIVEDDFRPLLSLPSRATSLGIPPEYDVCFLNERMQTKLIGEFSFIPVPEVVTQRASPHWAACGNEGYLVSRSGAEKLIRRVTEDGFFGDSDWRMLSYSVTPETVSHLSDDSFASKAINAHLQIIKPREPLRAYAANIGIIGLVATGSGREQQNIGKHAHEDLLSNSSGNCPGTG